MQKQYVIFFIVLAQLLVGCDLFMTTQKKSESFNAGARCDLNTEALGKYFTEIIEPELKCLESSLKEFIGIVTTDRPGFLSLDGLIEFATKDINDFDTDLIGPISGIFEMNSLLYGDNPRYIAKKNVSSLVEVFIKVNRTIVEKSVYKFFTDSSDKDYDVHNERKASIFEAFITISNILKEEYKANVNSLVFTSFLDKFEKLDDSNIIENSEKLIFIKKIFLGGDKNIFTSIELNRLLGLMPDLIKFVFDVSQFPYISKDLNDEEGMIQTLNAGSKVVLKSLYYHETSAEQIFTIDDLFDAVGIFYPKIMDYKKYSPELKKLKKSVLLTDNDSFSGEEIYYLIDKIVHENLDRGEFFYRAYMLNQFDLDAPQSINQDLSNIIFATSKEKDYFNVFNRIVKNYSYFKGSKKSAIFGNKIVRSPYSIFEISVLESLITKVISNYASINDNSLVNRVGLAQKDLDKIFVDFKKPLIDEGIVFLDKDTGKDRLKSTAETFTLMVTLFQAQSSGDAIMSVEELTEFAIGLLSSSSIGAFLHEQFSMLCLKDSSCELDDIGRYAPQFYRDNLFTVLDMSYGGKKIKDYYPGVADYLEKNDKDEFLKIAENFSRSCATFDDGTDVPMEQGDYFSMLVGLTAIEQTINRFDKHGVYSSLIRGYEPTADGILQPDEVMNAYPIYKSAIEEIIPVGFLKKYSKGFFQYLIKYEKVPDVEDIKSLRDFWRAFKNGAHFIKFLFTPQRSRAASADRYTLAKILEVLSEFSPESKENPFPCEKLR